MDSNKTKEQINKCKPRNRLINTENKLVIAGGKGGGRAGEIGEGIKRYKFKGQY